MPEIPAPTTTTSKCSTIDPHPIPHGRMRMASQKRVEVNR